MYTGPAIPANGDHIHELPPELADYVNAAVESALAMTLEETEPLPRPTMYEIGVGETHRKLTPTQAILGVKGVTDAGELPIRIKVPKDLKVKGKVRWWVKEGKLYGCVCVASDAGAKFCLTAAVPLAPIRKIIKRAIKKRAIEVGWNPFKAIADAGRWVGRTVKGIAQSKVVSRLTGMVNSIPFREIISKAAPVALSAFGVPPNLTSRAMGLVNQAQQPGLPKQYRQQATNKIANISQLASQGNLSAQKLWSVMSTYYRGGPQALYNAPARFPMPQPMRGMPYGMITPYQQPTPYGARVPGGSPYGARMPYGIQPMSVPWGRGRVSGWIYNIPWTPADWYGEGLKAKTEGWWYNKPYPDVATSLLQKSPEKVLRHLYHQGLQTT